MELDYKPSEDFIVNNSEPLINFDATDSKELWLIQLPLHQEIDAELDGKEFKVKLDKDGKLGGFEDSSGKEIDLVSFASQDAGASVIIPSGEDSKIVGKISRRVSLVSYPEPKELVEAMKKANAKKGHAGAVDSSYSNAAKSSRHKSGRSSVRNPASSRSSRQKSMFTGFTETPKSSKRKHSESSLKHFSSTHTVSGSSDRKSKKKMKTEN